MPRWSRLLARLLLAAAPLAAPFADAACAPQSATPAAAAKVEIDADPLAILPASAVVVARLDVHSICADPAVGPDVAPMADALVPFADGSTIVPSRDVDRATVGLYSTQKLDVTAVLSGRFDVNALGRITRTRAGTAVIPGTYGGFPTWTAGDLTWAFVTPRTMVAGTNDGVRFALDRLQKGPPERSLPPWAADTLQSPQAPVALIADFASQPVVAASLAGSNMAWLKAMRVARVLANLGPPGLNVAATVTYADPAAAQDATSALLAADRWLDLFSPLVGGLKLQGFAAHAEGADVRSSFALDTRGLRTLVALVPRFLTPNNR